MKFWQGAQWHREGGIKCSARTFEINLWKVVSCINLQRSIPEKKIFSGIWQIIKILLKLVWKSYHSWWFQHRSGKQSNEEFPLGDFLKGDGGSCIDLLITISKFSFMMINSFESGLTDRSQIYYSQNKIWKFEPKKLIQRNIKQYDSDQFKLDIFNSMSAMRIHAAFENNFFNFR